MSLKISNGVAGGAVEHADAAGRGGEVPVSGRKGKDVRRKGGGLFELVRNLSAEEFRESLLEAVIVLPANLFFGTGIPAAILIFNKGRTTGDVLFIDASREYKDAKNQSLLAEEHVQKIVDTYTAFRTVEKYAYRATPQEIADNDFNLNIPRYVDTFEEEADIARLESELAAVRGKMQAYLEELGV